MNCREVEAIITELERGVEANESALDHIRVCGRCRERLAEEEKLTAGLAAWAEATSAEQAAPGREAKLLEAFRENRAARRGRKWIPVVAAGSIAAAALLARMLTPAAPMAQVSPLPAKVEVTRKADAAPSPVPAAPEKTRVARRVARRSPGAAPVAPEVEFLPVAQGDGWTPLDGARLVRVGLPRAALRAFGLPMDEERAEQPVQADVMLSNDGLVRAIRFVK